MTLASDDRRHGTINGYGRHGCRCDQCRTVFSTYRRDYRRRHATHTPHVTFPAEPLDMIATAVDRPKGSAVRRAWTRAIQSGQISPLWADRFAVMAGRHVLELWPDYHDRLDTQ